MAPFLPIAVAAVAVGAFVWFLGLGEPGPREEMRVPVERPTPQVADSRAGANPGTLVPGAAEPGQHPGSWPQFRGPERDGVARSQRGVARSWPEGGPPVQWRITVGEGHAGAAIDAGRVYLVDYDRENEEDAVRCLSLDTGEEIWRFTYSVTVKRNHGMSRTTPAVADGCVVGFGPKCHVNGLDCETGERLWSRDLVVENGAEIPLWYAGQCPLIDRGRAILAPGADPLMMAVDVRTGEIVWETPEAYDGFGQTHGSIMPMRLSGRDQYVYCAVKGVVGVDAETGEVLWDFPDWTIKIANIASPVQASDDQIFLSGGYDKGSMMVQVRALGERFNVHEQYRLEAKVFGADQHTPILYEGHLYGMTPKPESAIVCLDRDGARLWSSSETARFSDGLGPYLVVNGLIFALSAQDGTLRLAEATPEGYRELASAQVLEGHDAWAPMAWAEGFLILRDLTEMICLDVGE